MKKLIAANWKMNKTVPEAVSAAKELKLLIKNSKNAEVAVCPPFTALEAVGKELEKTKIKLGAQNMHFEDSGAYTGDISPLMLKGIGCEYVILGHSERREFFKEDDVLINKKVMSALKNKLTPILCVGETLEQRSSSKAREVIDKQLRNCLDKVNAKQMQNVVIAYEPVWAISRGISNTKPATKEDAEEMHKFIREFLGNIFDSATAKNARIIYGGSVKPENAEELLSMPNINGALVGNASLNAKSFAEIVKAAEN
ncbi:triose-phosphate isomerase [Candidatus Woesearchaeota archaeon]|nr:triose-phosphate isomerase [Candidatus Woesearchaeota archaeon]